MGAVRSEADRHKKRKKEDGDPKQRSAKRRAVEEQSESMEDQVQRLEKEIGESRKHYNSIVTLLSMLKPEDALEPANIIVAVSLCRVFCRLLSAGHLNKPKDASEQDLILVAWLKERYLEYQRSLASMLNNANPAYQTTALTLSMQVLKEQTLHLSGSENYTWNGGFFDDVLAAVTDSESIRDEFVKNFMNKYHDITVYTVLRLTNFLSQKQSRAFLDNAIHLLSNLGDPAELDERLENTYTDLSSLGQKSKGPFVTASKFKLRVQAAWLALLRNRGITHTQRKHLLRVMSYAVAPWFPKPELLMDFLTDSYDAGGPTSLLALSGLFYLIQQKNLDYPQFYPKLYSLLNRDLLHSTHRSRFFRQLDTFLASTHLPTTLVASFIKRLARLALAAPPAAIVAIVPWIYNLLRAHPACTFMIHRDLAKYWPARHQEVLSSGDPDPFDEHETDPMRTGAIDSSLWEIETLQTHYHPNTAALARIISEQFTKQRYNLEDFLDHSYAAMLETELGREEKEMKRVPVVEFRIAKRVFTDRLLDGGVDEEPGKLVRELWDFS